MRYERRILGLRFTRRWGPHRIVYHLGLHRSTVGRVLARYRMPLLAHLDQATGLPVRKSKPMRYEAEAPRQLVHVDIRKQGRIPDGGRWRVHGRGSIQDRKVDARRNRAGRAGAAASHGYRYLHHAVDDYSRLAYSEILDDERKETAAGFWHRANAFFATAGITVTALMTDNGSCYRSRTFAAALGAITHKRTRLYRPQTNGKVERFNRTLADEWAHACSYRSEEVRTTTYDGSITTTTFDPTPESAASSPQPVFATSQGTTISRAIAPLVRRQLPQLPWPVALSSNSHRP